MVWLSAGSQHQTRNERMGGGQQSTFKRLKPNTGGGEDDKIMSSNWEERDEGRPKVYLYVFIFYIQEIG